MRGGVPLTPENHNLMNWIKAYRASSPSPTWDFVQEEVVLSAALPSERHALRLYLGGRRLHPRVLLPWNNVHGDDIFKLLCILHGFHR